MPTVKGLLSVHHSQFIFSNQNTYGASVSSPLEVQWGHQTSPDITVNLEIFARVLFFEKLRICEVS